MSQNTKEVEYYKAANDKWFTVRELINVIRKYSLYETAAQWFGGIDAHHVFFEGFTDSGSSNGRYGFTASDGAVEVRRRRDLRHAAVR